MNKFKSKIVGTAEVDPNDLVENPANWRQHPLTQRRALDKVLRSIGWVDSVKVNVNTGRMVDGHLRVDVAKENKETAVPVVYLDLTEEEEKLMLATLDPIGALADTNQEMFQKLVSELKSADDIIAETATSAELSSILLEIEEGKTDPYKEWTGMPEYTDPGHYMKIIVSFEDAASVETFCKTLGIKVPEQERQGSTKSGSSAPSIRGSTKSIWYPARKRESLDVASWEDEQ